MSAGFEQVQAAAWFQVQGQVKSVYQSAGASPMLSEANGFLWFRFKSYEHTSKPL